VSKSAANQSPEQQRRRSLDRELNRIRWAIHCNKNRRQILVEDLTVIERRLAKLNRELVDAIDRCGEVLDDEPSDDGSSNAIGGAL
jgi:hypothetical protein